MDRRTFIALLASGVTSAACQQAQPTQHLTRSAVVEISKPVDPLTFPRPATAVPTPSPNLAGVPTEAPRTFRTRTLPPERIIIPTIGVDSKVVPLGTKFDRSGATIWETAAYAVGHHRGSANPGEVGNIVLSGHISSPGEGAVFNKLPNLKTGDGIILITAQQPFMYVVDDTQVVKPTAVDVLNPTSSSIVTLITCVPDGIYSHRLIVRCDAV